MTEATDFIGKGLSGQIGKQLVFKHYKDKAVVQKYPSKTLIKLTELQIKQRSKFAEAEFTSYAAIHFSQYTCFLKCGF